MKEFLSFFTDPHLGASRSSHTTTGSRLLLRDRLFEAAENCLQSARGSLYCLGDLLDKFTNDEDIIKQAATVVSECEAVLGGNHDVRSRADAFGTLQLLSEFYEDKIAVGGTFEQPNYCTDYKTVNGQNVVMFFVPHAITQEYFDQLLHDARGGAADSGGCKRLLLLHCNYNNPFTEGKDTALNLSKERAAELLKVFDFILLGHEHVPREDFGGRLIVLGNTHPLSMGEIADRYMYHFDGETFEKELIWSKENHYAEVHANSILATDGKMSANKKEFAFVDVVGDVKVEQAPAFAKAMTNFWRENDTMLMCRDKTVREKIALDFEPGEAVAEIDVSAQIAESLKGTKFENLWTRYAGEAK